MIYERIIDAIGSTPLVRVPTPTDVKLYAKLEYFNPGGSIKDRAALYMIEQAELRGDLKPGGTIIEASSGNQGISAAYIGIAKGYRVMITVSEKVSAEKRATLAAFGATVITCPATTELTNPIGYYPTAVRLHQATPNSIMLNQYFNPDNTEAHYHSLGPEIWRQTEGKVTHFIAAAGSGGTVSGAGRYLKEQNPHIQVIAVDAATSYRTTCGQPQPYAIEGMGVDYDTPLLNMNIIDRFFPVADNDAIEMLRTLSHKHGILVGPASGAVGYAAQQIALTAPQDSYILMLCGDSGRAYLTKQFYTVATPPQAEHAGAYADRSSHDQEIHQADPALHVKTDTL